MDGASHWQMFTHMTLPHMRQYLELAGLLGSIYVIQTFDAVYTITSGALGTANLPFTIYQTLFTAQDYGLASAQGVIVVIGSIMIATFAVKNVSSLLSEDTQMTITATRPPPRPPDPTRRETAGQEPARQRRARPSSPGRSGCCSSPPWLWMVLTSFHSEIDAASNPPDIFAPLTLDGYKAFFGGESGASPWPSLINSAWASIGSTILVILLAIPAAYALSVKPVRKWTDVMFFFLTTKMLPAVAGLMPIYLIAAGIGLLDNIWFMVIIYTAMNLPIAIWMLRSFLADVPPALFEAASIDGANLVQTLRRIIVPIISPGIAATALICFIFAWNELLFAKVLTGVVAQTAPVYLTGFVTSQGLFLAQLCAATTVVSLPVLIAGFAAQDKLVQGLSLGAVK